MPKVFFALLNPLTIHAQYCKPRQQIMLHAGAFCVHDLVRNTNVALVERLGLKVSENLQHEIHNYDEGEYESGEWHEYE